jgi:hypothetical protein
MRYLICTLLLMLVCLHPGLYGGSSETPKEFSKQDMQLLKGLKTKHGFQGVIEKETNPRLSSVYKGKLPLIAPSDTTLFKKNCDKIATYFEDLLKYKNTPYTIKPDPRHNVYEYWQRRGSDSLLVSYNLTYNQYYYGFEISDEYLRPPPHSSLEVNTIGSIEISYNCKDNSYTIGYGLCMKPIPLPKPRISEEQAIRIVKERIKKFAGSNSEQLKYVRLGSKCLYIFPLANNENEYIYIYDIYIDYRNEGNRDRVDALTGEILDPLFFVKRWKK